MPKLAHLVQPGDVRLLFAAESCNLESDVYEHIHRAVGDDEHRVHPCIAPHRRSEPDDRGLPRPGITAERLFGENEIPIERKQRTP